MNFDKFADTADRGRRDDYAAAPVGSTASEATKRDARGKMDQAAIAKAVEQLDHEISAGTNRMAQIQARQGVLRNKVRGRQLPTGEYDRIRAEQNALLMEYSKLRGEHAEKKVRRHRLNQDLNHAKVNGEDGVARQLRVANNLLKLILAELKGLNLAWNPPAGRPEDSQE